MEYISKLDYEKYIGGYFDAPPRQKFRSYYPQICGGHDYSEGNYKWQ